VIILVFGVQCFRKGGGGGNNSERRKETIDRCDNRDGQVQFGDARVQVVCSGKTRVRERLANNICPLVTILQAKRRGKIQGREARGGI
jgi:hypothetical protein